MSGTNFFEFREKLVAKKPAPRPADGPPPPKPHSVSELTRLIDGAIRSGVPSRVHVQGELSNLNHHRGSGHLYFTLKDADACVDCVMFRSDAERLKFRPEDGIELVASGRVAVYPARGRYQLYVTSLHPLGRGALEIAFQQLREKLERDGLFAAERKKPIPPYPLRIALVTSRNTAALQDMLKVLRRFPCLKLMVYHVPVQGDGSAERIAAALKHLNRTAAQSRIDMILLGRGGGSLEDLWEFNEEIVARAIAESAIPIVTGIGHEVDVSIADLVADYHAHTPTEAAQIVTAQWRNAQELLRAAATRLHRAVAVLLTEAKQRLRHVERHEVFRRPTDRINQLRQMLDERQGALAMAFSRPLRREQSRVDRLTTLLLERHPRHAVDLARHRLAALDARARTAMLDQHRRRLLRVDAMEKHLEAVSPYRVLQRGYSMTMHKKRNRPVKSAKELREGDRIVTHFADGSVESTVDDPDQPGLFD